MKTPRPQLTSVWYPDMNEQMRRIEEEFMKVYARLDDLEDFVKYVDETAPELRTAYRVSKRIE